MLHLTVLCIIVYLVIHISSLMIKIVATFKTITKETEKIEKNTSVLILLCLISFEHISSFIQHFYLKNCIYIYIFFGCFRYTASLEILTIPWVYIKLMISDYFHLFTIPVKMFFGSSIYKEYKRFN